MSETDSWSTHSWPQEAAHLVEREPGHRVLHVFCKRCRRDFVIDLASHERYAVHVSLSRFNRLEADANERWLQEPCPGEPLERDDEDRRRISTVGRRNGTPMYRPIVMSDEIIKPTGIVLSMPSHSAK